MIGGFPKLYRYQRLYPTVFREEVTWTSSTEVLTMSFRSNYRTSTINFFSLPFLIHLPSKEGINFSWVNSPLRRPFSNELLSFEWNEPMVVVGRAGSLKRFLGFLRVLRKLANECSVCQRCDTSMSSAFAPTRLIAKKRLASISNLDHLDGNPSHAPPNFSTAKAKWSKRVQILH